MRRGAPTSGTAPWVIGAETRPCRRLTLRFMESHDAFLARIGILNRDGFVAQAFEPAGPGDFPVARSWSTGLESPVNPQAGKPALQAGSWVGRPQRSNGADSSRAGRQH